MAPKPRPKRAGSPLRDTDEKKWTLIAHRSKSSKTNQLTESTLEEETSSEVPLQPTEPGALPTRSKEFPAVDRSNFHGYPPFKSFSWHQEHAPLNSQARKEPTERRRLMGHPDVLYKDYKKKRKRGLPMTDDEDSSSSESDLETESDSTLDSECGDDHQTENFEDSATEETDHIHSQQQYAFLRRDLVEFIYTLFVIWMASVRYIIPPEHRLKRPKKRTKRTRMFIEETDPNDSSTILISPFDGYYHLACPFYLSNTNQHQNCVIKHSLKSIEDLVDHIESHHAEPPLCKICGKVFPSFKERNDHLRNETCEPAPQENNNQTPHGVSQLQRVRILKRDNPRRAEQDRWERIYKTIFQSEPKPSVSPYLMDGEGLKFSLLHDYWKLKGKECAREYLADHGHAGDEGYGSTEFARLCSLVLGDLRERVLEEEGKNVKVGEGDR